jgi:hypothetical protein
MAVHLGEQEVHILKILQFPLQEYSALAPFIWIWDSKCCNKLRVFSWLLMDRLNTRNILKREKHKLEGNNYNCVLCSNNVEETAFHLFFNCPFSQACWQLLGIHWDFIGDFFQMMGGPGASGRVLLTVTGRSRVQVVTSLYLHIARVRLTTNTLP